MGTELLSGLNGSRNPLSGFNQGSLYPALHRIGWSLLPGTDLALSENPVLSANKKIKGVFSQTDGVVGSS
jgi:hypothetical protein